MFQQTFAKPYPETSGMRIHHLAIITAITLTSALVAAPPLPSTADGKPNFTGIWQASGSAAADLRDHAARLNMPAGVSVVAGGEIPYQPWAAAKKAENFQHRQTADPLSKCYMPGTPRIMYLDSRFRSSRRRA